MISIYLLPDFYAFEHEPHEFLSHAESAELEGK